MVDFEEIVEITFKEFDLVVDIIYESKLIDEKLLDLDNAIIFIKNKLVRNKAKIFVQKHENEVVGFLILYYKVNALSSIKYNWHVSYLYVKPAFRGLQIGKKIMLKCIDYARQTKVEHISLNTDAGNHIAHNLYESLGFNRKNFIANYYYYEANLVDL